MQSSALDRIRNFGTRNEIAYERLLEALIAQATVTDEALEAARRTVREADRFEIANEEGFPP